MNIITRKHAGCLLAGPLKDSASLTSACGSNPPSWWWQMCWCSLKKCAFEYLTWEFPGNYMNVRSFYLVWSKIRSYMISQQQLYTYAAGQVLLAGWRWCGHTFPVSSLQAHTSFFSDTFSLWCGTSVCSAACVASSTLSLTELRWFICSTIQWNRPRLLLRLRWNLRTYRWKPDRHTQVCNSSLSNN